MVEEDMKEEGDDKEHSKRSTCKGLFLALQLDYRLIEGWFINKYEYIRDTYKIIQP